MKYCQFGMSPVNHSDPDSETIFTPGSAQFFEHLMCTSKIKGPKCPKMHFSESLSSAIQKWCFYGVCGYLMKLTGAVPVLKPRTEPLGPWFEPQMSYG